MKKKTIYVYILATTILLFNLTSVQALDLTLTIQTDKENYLIGETVNIFGQVLIDGQKVNESLVGIQVNDPNNKAIIYRTYFIYEVENPPVLEGDLNGDGYVDIFDAVKIALAFGAEYGDPNYDLTADINKDGIVDIFDMVVVAIHFGEGTPPHSWRIEIIDTFIADYYGRPVSQAKRGSLYFIWVRFKNNQSNYIKANITYTIYDSEGNPLYSDRVAQNVPPGGPHEFVSAFTVPTDAALGTAKIYANAYSNLPQDKGYPHCPEKSSTFEIISSTASQKTSSTSITNTIQQNESSYSTSFRLKTGIQTGTYTAHATAFCYTGVIILLSYNLTSFTVSSP
ncbi:MAG: dockerin type I domain-containing protein [Candidatus Bathyarchaeia archaeon]